MLDKQEYIHCWNQYDIINEIVFRMYSCISNNKPLNKENVQQQLEVLMLTNLKHQKCYVDCFSIKSSLISGSKN